THLTEADAEAVRREGGAWTPADVPLLDEAAELLGEDDSAAQAAAEAARQERVAYAQGVLELAYASRTYEFEDKDDEDSEVLGAHDVIDAERPLRRRRRSKQRPPIGGTPGAANTSAPALRQHSTRQRGLAPAG
ncbi:hypothetical protein ACFWFL_21115, partial [Nocardia asteroides]